MKFPIFAATLLTAVHAASVHLATTSCIQPNQLEEFDIPIIGASDKPVVKQLNNVCGIKVVSADGINIVNAQCQAYRDADGTSIGSALFSYDNPALISTNGVTEGSIKCVVAPVVRIVVTKCENPDTNPMEHFDIQASVASDSAIPRPIKNACGLKITGVLGADENSVSCQAFKDADGTQPGSAVFTYANPALISTNPVEEGSIRCTVSSSSVKARRFVAPRLRRDMFRKAIAPRN